MSTLFGGPEADGADLYYLLLFNRRNEAGLNHFHKKFYRLIEAYAHRFLNSIPESDDIPDDCFIAAWHSTFKFPTVRNLRNFLMTCARNKCVNLMNSPKHGKEISREELPAVYTRDPNMDLEDKELYQRLLQKINEMPEDVRKVVNDKWEGMRNKDIAEKHGFSQNYVASILSKFKKWLRGR